MDTDTSNLLSVSNSYLHDCTSLLCINCCVYVPTAVLKSGTGFEYRIFLKCNYVFLLSIDNCI